jgi:hypothetical protein
MLSTYYSETSVLTRATRRNNPEDTILHSHRRENLKSYIRKTDKKHSVAVVGTGRRTVEEEAIIRIWTKETVKENRMK